MGSMVEGTARVRTAPPATVDFARQLRRRMSLPEVTLWRELRLRPGGLKFRRQHPVGPYVEDFFCMCAKLVVEVDGDGHGIGDRPEQDERRDAFLTARGLRVVRVAARDVLGNCSAVVDHILAEAAPAAPSTVLRSPSPDEGGF